MSKLNLKEASLLDVSGELGSPARGQLMAHISTDSNAQEKYQRTCDNFALLQTLPIPEPSAAQRQFIPARIKLAIHRALGQFDKPAAPTATARPRTRFRYAAASLALAACMVVAISLSHAQRAHDARLRDQTVRINSQIDRLAGLSGPPAANEQLSPYDQALTEVAACIRQLQTESPTLADLHDKGLANLFSTLAALPVDTLSAGADWDDSDYSVPPGSY